jgi:hypothetical protein
MKSAMENSVTPMTAVPKKTPPPAKRDWLKTAGWAKNDALYAEAVRLGQEYRSGRTV